MNIILCDDNNIQLEIMSGYISEYYGERENIFIKSYERADIINNSINEFMIDVAFLDIEMEGMSGINLGKAIRKEYPEAIIIFITGFKEHAITAFSIRALDYLIKPVRKEKIISLLDEIDELYKLKRKENSASNNVKYFSFKRNRKLLKIPYDEIVAFEKIDRKIRLFSLSGVYEFVGTLKTLIDEIEMQHFFQCHQSYIVNRRFVKEFSNPEIIVPEIGLKIPVNRSSKLAIKEMISK